MSNIVSRQCNYNTPSPSSHHLLNQALCYFHQTMSRCQLFRPHHIWEVIIGEIIIENQYCFCVDILMIILLQWKNDVCWLYLILRDMWWSDVKVSFLWTDGDSDGCLGNVKRWSGERRRRGREEGGGGGRQTTLSMWDGDPHTRLMRDRLGQDLSLAACLQICRELTK